MIRLLREFRLIPIVLIATGCLFALKVLGLLLDGGYLLGSRSLKNDVIQLSMSSATQSLPSPSVPLNNRKSSWMGEMFGYPADVTGSVNPTAVPPPPAPKNNHVAVTGSSAAPSPPPNATPADKDGKPPVAKNPPPANMGSPISLDGMRTLSAAERAILERLQERRQELDARARELDIRETMVKEAEKKLDDRTKELKELEAKVSGGAEGQEKANGARFKSLATMYENMKAKDAAKIFDRLDVKVLIDMSSQINPRRMSEILAQMSPEVAERLTLELASRASGGEKPANPANLPKIEGRPNGS